MDTRDNARLYQIAHGLILRMPLGVGSNPAWDIHLNFSLPTRSSQPGEARTNEIKHDINPG